VETGRDLADRLHLAPALDAQKLLSFAMHPRWAADYFMHEKFELPQLNDYVKEGSESRYLSATISARCSTNQ